MTTATADPIALVVDDRARARAAGDPLADLCVLATAGASEPGRQGCTRSSFVTSGPGIGLLISTHEPEVGAALGRALRGALLWLAIRRQYRVRGGLAPMPDALVETYWNQKVHESRLLDVYYAAYGAQSTAVPSRERFLEGIDTLRQQYPSPEAVPRPELLRGVYLVPERIEAWRGFPDRLHDRRRFYPKRKANGARRHSCPSAPAPTHRVPAIASISHSGSCPAAHR